MRKRSIAIITLVLLLTSLFSSVQPALAQDYAPIALGKASASVKIKTITMAVTSKSLYVGDSPYQAVVSIEPKDATNPALTWKSSDAKIATVGPTGIITPKKAGKATITATAQDGSKKKATIKITVKNVVPQSVTLSDTKVTLMPGEKITLIPSVAPTNATSKSVTWSTSSKTKATVSKTGVVTAKKAGTVKITATTKSGKQKATCTVTVLNDKPSSVSLDATAKTVYVGETFTLTPTVNPSYAKNKLVTWSTSNKKIATVSSKGVVTAKAAGTVKITVKTKSASKKKTCTVTVKPIVPTSVSLNYEVYAMKPKASVTLKVTVLPANATTKTITWSSSNKKIATVSSKGVVKALKNGTVKITGKTKSGGIVASCAITVNAVGEIVPASITLSDSALRLGLNSQYTLAATVNPANATDKVINWTSGDPSIATVSSSGVVTPKKEGTVTITAATRRNNKLAKCTVTILNENVPTSVSISPRQYSLYSGTGVQLGATVSPASATDQSVIWSSDNKGVATVDSNGYVSAKAPGKANITVKTNTGNQVAYCEITVNQKTDTTVYRAFMIGNSKYPGAAALEGPALDVAVMKAVLTNGQYKSENIYDYYDRTTTQMQDILRSMQNYSINENDVTLFYYSGHGLSDSLMAGALMGVEYRGYLAVQQVQAYLDAVPGTVIVVLDSCLSGSFIQSRAVSSKFTSQSDESAVHAFNKAYVDAFSETTVKSKALTDSQYSGKYKVLTAASATGSSFSTNGFSSNRDWIGVFTHYFANGAGYYPFNTTKVTAAMPADTNNDKAVTLAEMYSYTGSRVASYMSKMGYVQSVMIYPSGDRTALVKKN